MTREEAIEVLKKKVEYLESDKRFKAAVKTLIPELAESEEEKIRKALIEVFKKKLERGFEWVEYGIPNRSVLDWLEKQKECVSNNFDDVWDEEDCEEIIAEGQKLTPRFKELLKEVCHAWYDRGTKLEKQKEASKAIEAVDRIDKYIDEHLANAHDMKDSNPDKKYYRGWDDALGEMARILQDVYSGEKQKESLRDFIDNFPYSDEQKEEKPSIFPPGFGEVRWNPISSVQQKPAEVDESTKRLNDNWMKQHFDDYKKQKPEWGEEDEKDMAHIIRILDDCYVYGTHDLSKTDHENLVNKLKSLRPSWKPSEEQMKALYDACCIAFVEERDFHTSLSRLYHDLRKL